MDKLQKLQYILEKIKKEKVTPNDLKEFIVFLLAEIKKSKEDLSVITEDKLRIIDDYLSEVATKHNLFKENLDSELSEKELKIKDNFLSAINISKNEFLKEIQEAQRIIKELKSIKLRNGKDGRDGTDGISPDPNDIVPLVLEQIKLPEQKEIILDGGEEIVEKINDLPTDDDILKIDFKHIKNAPDFTQKFVGGGSTARNFYQLFDVPSTYAGQAGKSVSVKSTEDGLEFTANVATDEKVKLNASDPTAGYLDDKITGYGFITDVSSKMDKSVYDPANGNRQVAFSDEIPSLSGYLQNNIGIAGGTTLIGGTATGENLTLSSTSHATKGKILFGTSAYDEVNNRLGINIVAPTERLDIYQGNINFKQAPNPTNAVTLVQSAGSGPTYVTEGSHSYTVRFLFSDGTISGTGGYFTNITVVGATQKVDISNIPISTDADCVGRILYRTTTAQYPNGFYVILDTINDNTTTTYTDVKTDATIGTAYKFYNAAGAINNTAGAYKVNSLPLLYADTMNTYFGVEAGGSNNIRTGIASFGYRAGYSNRYGSDNTNIGYQAGYSNADSNSNTNVGRGAGYYNTSAGSLFVGSYTGFYNTTGLNSMFGAFAGNSPDLINANRTTTGTGQTLIGTYSGQASTTQRNYLNVFGYRSVGDQHNLTVLGGTGLYGTQVAIQGTTASGNLDVQQSSQGFGTVSNSAGGTTVTGVGTYFTNTFKVGDSITIGTDTVVISVITSDTSMTTGAITNAHAVGTAYTVVGSGSRFVVKGNGLIGIGIVPTSRLTLPAGSATANTAPFQLTSGALETVARDGVVEYLTNDIYITDTSAIRTPLVRAIYGSMYVYNLDTGGTTITVSATDTWYEIGTGVTGGTTNQMTFQNNHELKVLVAGTYQINWNLGLESATANQELEGTIMINGTANTSFANHTEAQTANESASLGGTGIITLAVNDVISLAVLNHTGANNVVIDHLTLSALRVGI